MRRVLLLAILVLLLAPIVSAQRTVKPPLHGRHWMAITGKPLGATAGAMMFQKGGNAVDAACAMLGAVSTMWDTLSWGGETQALIFNPKTGRSSGSTRSAWRPPARPPEFFRGKGMPYPPDYGPLAAVTPGTPGGLMVMLAEYGTTEPDRRARPRDPDGRRLRDRGAGRQRASKRKRRRSRSGRTRRRSSCRTPGEKREAPEPGEIFRQPDLAATLRKLVEAEQQARAAGQEPEGGHLRRVRPLLQGRYRRRSSRADRRRRAACTRRRTSRTGRCTSRSR